MTIPKSSKRKGLGPISWRKSGWKIKLHSCRVKYSLGATEKDHFKILKKKRPGPYFMKKIRVNKSELRTCRVAFHPRDFKNLNNPGFLVFVGFVTYAVSLGFCFTDLKGHFEGFWSYAFQNKTIMKSFSKNGVGFLINYQGNKFELISTIQMNSLSMAF